METFNWADFSILKEAKVDDVCAVCGAEIDDEDSVECSLCHESLCEECSLPADDVAEVVKTGLSDGEEEEEWDFLCAACAASITADDSLDPPYISE
jgi:hypothetical protein